MASTSIQRSRTAGSTKTKFTISMWVKKSANNEKYLMVNRTDDSNRGLLQFGGSDELLFQSKYSNTNNAVLQTNRKFRDTSAWYHFVLTGDSTLSTAADRLKLYVNGVRETSFASETQISQNGDFYMNEATTNGFRIGEKGDGSDYFDGLMSHVHFTDGYAYQASTFGSTDSTTGEWEINTSPSVTYGTNGFFLKMEDGTNMDLDSSSNNLTFSTNGTLTKTEDCPSNVFATWNPLDNYYAASTFSNGNTSLTSGGSGIETYNTSTLGMSSGKYYMELKHNGGSASPFRQLVGITQNPTDAAGQYLGGDNNDSWGYYDYNGGVAHNASTVVTYSTWTQNDIIGVAVDLDNSKLFFSKNGTWQNSSDPANGTNGISIDSGVTYYFAWGDLTTHSNYCQANFGNGYFGTTQVSSAGTNASGNGIFEYDVPTGYTALSTKGLNL